MTQKTELLVRSIQERLVPIIRVMSNGIKRLVGQKVKAARKAKGLTQEELAEAIEKTVETVSNIERGVKLPGLSTLENIRKVLGVKLSDLVDQ